MTPEQIAPVVHAAPKPYFDEDARLNPLLSIEAQKAASPYFARRVRHLIWLREGTPALRKYALRAFRGDLLFLAIGTLIIFFLSDGTNILLRQPFEPLELIWSLAGACTFSSIGRLLFSLVSDLLMEYRLLGLWLGGSAEWDLVRLTMLSRRGIIVSIYAYWRYGYCYLMFEIFNVRLLSLCVLALLAVIVNWTGQQTLGLYGGFLPSVFAIYAMNPLAVASVLVVGLILLFEARWRLNGASALAVAISFTVYQKYHFPAQIGACVASWLGQILIALMSWLLGGWIVSMFNQGDSTLALFGNQAGGEFEWLLLHILTTSLVFGLLLYGYFRLMRFLALRVAFRSFQRDS